jgi:hypothetical protein
MTKKKTKAKTKSRAVAVHKQTTGTAIAIAAPPRTTLELLLAAAKDPSVDVGKMQALIDMGNAEKARIAELQFNEALQMAQVALPRVVKRKKGENNKYAALEDISDAIDPVAHKYGFSLSYGTADSNMPGHYRITAKLSHVAGHSRDYFIDLPSDMTGPKGGANKTGVQGIGSTVSYGRRYLKVLIFDVALIGEDNDGVGSNAVVSDKQLDDLIDKSDKYGVDKRKFCAFMGVDSYASIPAKRFNEAVAALNGFRAGAAKAAGEQGETAA